MRHSWFYQSSSFSARRKWRSLSPFIIVRHEQSPVAASSFGGTEELSPKRAEGASQWTLRTSKDFTGKKDRLRLNPAMAEELVEGRVGLQLAE